MVRLDTSAYAGRASVSVEVDGQPFYEGAPRYAWVTNEEKNSAGDPSTPANWLPNDGSAAGASAFAGESALYLWLPKGADHVLAVGGEEFYKATWDEASGAFALAADAEAQAAYDAERAAEVDGLIAAIPADATDAGAQAAVDAAVAAYAALTPAQRALVSNVADLLGAQAAVAAAQAAQTAAQAEAARAEAQAQGERAQAAESGLAAKAAEAAVAQARAVAAQARIAALQAQVEAASAAQGLKANPMTAKAKTVKAKAGKKKTVKRSKAFTVKGAKGKVTFYKVSGNAKITVTKAGKVKVKKGLKAKKKAYKVKVLVVAAGDKDYAPAVRTVTLKVKVK
jgi:hypothetical protein